MANVLGNLFKDIADAIRSKNGETGTMKPAEFPEKIADIQTESEAPEPVIVPIEITENGTYTTPEGVDGYSPITVDVNSGSGGGNGGGGSIDGGAGVYLSIHPTAEAPTAYRYRMFKFNGVYYASSSNLAGGGYFNRLYKFTENGWTNLLSADSTSSGINGANVDSNGYKAVEYHGKMHFFDVNVHAVFDGTSLVRLQNPPANISGENSVVVYQDRLYAYLEYGMSIYEWDEASDTWSIVATISTNTYTSWYLFVVDGELYAGKSGVIFHFENGEMVETGKKNFPSNWRDFTIIRDKNLYSIRTGSRISEFRRYNFETEEYSTFALPAFNSAYGTVGESELFSFVGTTNTSSTAHPCFSVHIVEANE